MTLPNKKKALILLIGEVLEDPRVLKTCRSLREAGADVTIACTDPSGRVSEEVFEELHIIRFPHRRDSFLKRCYLWLQGWVKPEVGQILAQAHEEAQPSRLQAVLRNLVLWLNYYSFSRQNMRINRMMVRAFLKERFDLVHANDVDTLHAGCQLKRAGVTRRLIYDSHEYWPGVGVHGSAVNNAIRRLEAAGIGETDRVITVNSFIADMIQKEYSLVQTPSVLLNCPYRDKRNIETNIVHSPVRVLYQGKVQAFRGIENLILSFHFIEGAELTISGDGPLLERFRLLAESEGLSEKVRFTGRFEPEETLNIVREHDIGVLPFSPSTLSIIYSSPNKLFDYAMGGLAIVATDLPFLRKVVEENGMGVLFPRSDSKCIAEALQSLIRDIGCLKKYRCNARKAAREKYSWEEQFAENYPW